MLFLGELNEELKKIENKFIYVNEKAGTKHGRNAHVKKKKGFFAEQL